MDDVHEGQASELRLSVVELHLAHPKVQAMQATTYGETPVNKKACVQMEKLAKGSCTQYSANAPADY